MSTVVGVDNVISEHRLVRLVHFRPGNARGRAANVKGPQGATRIDVAIRTHDALVRERSQRCCGSKSGRGRPWTVSPQGPIRSLDLPGRNPTLRLLCCRVYITVVHR